MANFLTLAQAVRPVLGEGAESLQAMRSGAGAGGGTRGGGGEEGRGGRGLRKVSDVVNFRVD